MTTSQNVERCLVLVDAENLLGTSDPTEGEARWLHGRLLNHLEGGIETHFEVACSHRAARAVRFGFLTGRHCWRSGKDGADLALIDVLRLENIGDRFTRVVVASGDGIFAEYIAELASHGVECTVISRHESLSRRSALAAHKVVYLADRAEDEGEVRAA